MHYSIGISRCCQRCSARSSYAFSQRATSRSNERFVVGDLRAEARRRCGRRGASEGAGADMMSAPDHVDAWCTGCGRRSQRSPLPHSKLTTAHDPRPRTDRRCRSADAALRTTSLSAAGLDVTSVCDLVALVDGSLPKLSHELERSIMQRMSA